MSYNLLINGGILGLYNPLILTFDPSTSFQKDIEVRGPSPPQCQPPPLGLYKTLLKGQWVIWRGGYRFTWCESVWSANWDHLPKTNHLENTVSRLILVITIFIISWGKSPSIELSQQITKHLKMATELQVLRKCFLWRCSIDWAGLATWMLLKWKIQPKEGWYIHLLCKHLGRVVCVVYVGYVELHVGNWSNHCMVFRYCTNRRIYMNICRGHLFARSFEWKWLWLSPQNENMEFIWIYKWRWLQKTKKNIFGGVKVANGYR